ncbi:MAG: hypothetical protein ACR2LT_00710 [Pyrinomonadaceae bacterium]
MNFTIYLPLDSYINPNGELDTFGKIHVNLGDSAFPSEDWTDFGRIIILHWLNNINKILASEIKVVECSFMDGPYSFYIEEISKSVWKISTVKRWFDGKKDGETIEKEEEINSKQIVDEIFKAAEARRNFDAKNDRQDIVKQNEETFQKFQIANQHYFGKFN